MSTCAMFRLHLCLLIFSFSTVLVDVFAEERSQIYHEKVSSDSFSFSFTDYSENLGSDGEFQWDKPPSFKETFKFPPFKKEWGFSWDKNVDKLCPFEDINCEVFDDVETVTSKEKLDQPPGALKPFVKFQLSPGLLTEVLYLGLTVALIAKNIENELVNCQLVQFGSPEATAAALKVLPLSSYGPQREESIEKMVDIISDCTQLNATHPNHQVGARLGLDLLWCRKGSQAVDFYSLGFDDDADRCCRAHDYCPVSIDGGASRDGFFNPTLFTRSHCLCDEELYRCLKSVNAPTAEMVGRVYFDMGKLKCLDFDGTFRHFESIFK